MCGGSIATPTWLLPGLRAPNRYDALVLIPCSLSTLGKVAAGIADTLITRAAQVALKERLRLVLCVRETPWSSITLRNALRVSEAGGIVMPVAPPWYRNPTSMEEVVDGFCDKVLGVLGVPEAPGVARSGHPVEAGALSAGRGACRAPC